GAGEAAGVRLVRRKDRQLSHASVGQADHGATSAHAYLWPWLSFYQRNAARFQAARGRDLSGWPVAVRAGREVAVRHLDRHGGTIGRKTVRPETRGLFPRAHFRAAEDE